jgi:hypothetical protein
MQGQAGMSMEKTLDPIWHLLKGIVFWVIWIGKSNLVFNKHSWSLYQIESIVWNMPKSFRSMLRL